MWGQAQGVFTACQNVLKNRRIPGSEHKQDKKEESLEEGFFRGMKEKMSLRNDRKLKGVPFELKDPALNTFQKLHTS